MKYTINGRTVKVCKTLPKGWEVDNHAMTQPVGTVWINNGKSLFKKGKDGKPQRKQALLIQDEKLMIERIAQKRRYGKEQASEFILDNKTEARVSAEMKRQTRADKAWELEREKRTKKAVERTTKKALASFEVGATIKTANGIEGRITQIKQDKINAPRGTSHEGKPYAIIEWKNPKRGQQRQTNASITYLENLAKNNGIIISSKPAAKKSAAKKPSPKRVTAKRTAKKK